jgi:ABC-2 type transport system ATP-binding protein
VLAVETPRTLSRLMSQFERIDFEWDNDGLTTELRALPGVASVSPIVERNSYRIELSDESGARGVLNFLVASGVTSIRTSRPSLEEVYLHIIGRKS